MAKIEITSEMLGKFKKEGIDLNDPLIKRCMENPSEQVRAMPKKCLGKRSVKDAHELCSKFRKIYFEQRIIERAKEKALEYEKKEKESKEAEYLFNKPKLDRLKKIEELCCKKVITSALKQWKQECKIW
jgi:hypothetical protein